MHGEGLAATGFSSDRRPDKAESRGQQCRCSSNQAIMEGSKGRPPMLFRGYVQVGPVEMMLGRFRMPNNGLRLRTSDKGAGTLPSARLVYSNQPSGAIPPAGASAHRHLLSLTGKAFDLTYEQ